MAVNQGVRIEGLKEFRRALRSADPKFVKEFRTAGKDAAEQVVGPAQARGSSLGGVAAKAARDIRAGGDAKGGFIRYGGKGYSMGAEFGSITYHQFKAWRGSGGDAGYFLYPTIRAKHEAITEVFGDALDRIAREAFPS